MVHSDIGWYRVVVQGGVGWCRVVQGGVGWCGVMVQGGVGWCRVVQGGIGWYECRYGYRVVRRDVASSGSLTPVRRSAHSCVAICRVATPR